jgi:DNA-binding GntR family transcriptional regulator
MRDEGVHGRTHRSEELYERLRRLIVMGELRPNEPLIEVAIAERLGVSRTPVRECLQRLFAAGLVVPRNRGWAVREFQATHVRENAEIRAALEGYAAYLAAERASTDQLAAIVNIHEERLGLRATDEEKRVETNRNFHDAIIRASGNPSLGEAIYRLGQFYFSGTVARRAADDVLAQGNADHGLIVAALLDRDGTSAEHAMRDHIYRTFAVYSSIRRTEPATSGDEPSSLRRAPVAVSHE